MDSSTEKARFVISIATMVFTFFTALSTGYIAYMLYRFVDALQQMGEELSKLGS